MNYDERLKLHLQQQNDEVAEVDPDFKCESWEFKVWKQVKEVVTFRKPVTRDEAERLYKRDEIEEAFETEFMDTADAECLGPVED